MLYFILPPVVIVVGIVLITIIISRKSTEIERLKDREHQVTAAGHPMKRIAGHIGSALSSVNLKLLERLVQWAKVMSLRFHNASSRWFMRIKERKDKRMKKKAEEIPQKEEIEEKAPIQAEAKKEKKFKFKFIEEVRGRKRNKLAYEEEVVEPMISRKVIHPDSINEAKSKFEEILVERIASNPRDMEAYERLGEYYLERECYGDAKECFMQVTKLSPGHYKAKLKLRRIEKMAE